MIRQIICAKYMEMKLDKFKKLVQKVEQSDWFKQALSHGIVVRNYFPNTDDGALLGSKHMGQFTGNGFVFSCKEFAVEYCVEDIDKMKFNQANLRESASSKRFLLKHISDRNRITWRIMSIIAKRQYRFIRFGEPLTLRTLPYQLILDDYKNRYPNYFMDVSIISRVVKNKPVFLPNGEDILLHHLLPRKSYLVGVRLKDIISREIKSLTDTQLRDELSKQYAMDYSTRYAAYCRHKMGIPPARSRGSDHPNFLLTWARVFIWIRQSLLQYRRILVCTN